MVPIRRTRAFGSISQLLMPWKTNSRSLPPNLPKPVGSVAEIAFRALPHLKALPGAWGGVPKIRALFETTYFAGLRKAGMPEE